ncbi:MAG: GntR family transcriptional regulator [Solirubrobacterales bacterium]
MEFELHPSASLVLKADEPAADKAYRAVLDAIAAGSAPAGALLTEGQVAEATGMSRTPVREAFLRLSTEGLLDLYPKRGAIVTAPSTVETEQLLEVRAMFEKSAVAWMAERGVPADLEPTLRGHLDAQAGAADALEFARSDRSLHEEIVAAGGNSIATALFAQTGPRLLRYWHLPAERAEDRARMAAEHGELVELVLAADAPGFAAKLDRHMAGARR